MTTLTDQKETATSIYESNCKLMNQLREELKKEKAVLIRNTQVATKLKENWNRNQITLKAIQL